jgi:hypothetical protein
MNILMIHGLATPEKNPNPYDTWQTAITNGLTEAGYGGKINASPDTNGVMYNDVFDNPKYPADGAEYARALLDLLESAVWHTTEPAVVRPYWMDEGAGMAVKWIVYDDLRSKCRDLLVTQIETIKPDVFIAHSLGTLLCYDLFVNDPRGKTVFEHGIFVTFGSQIANSFVKDRMWDGKVTMVKAKRWYNLYNSHDPVFVEPIRLDDGSNDFYPITVKPPFGKPIFDVDGTAHQPTYANGHVGYLDNDTTNKQLWPALAVPSEVNT